ncbi:MAG: hypothetical protein CMJ49_13725 [Planctomycetaceae bacterium]|nr:hypothetical protein [Planctomycetaceae bacterium]
MVFIIVGFSAILFLACMLIGVIMLCSRSTRANGVRLIFGICGSCLGFLATNVAALVMLVIFGSASDLFASELGVDFVSVLSAVLYVPIVLSGLFFGARFGVRFAQSLGWA